jgi:hypothetical protein
VSPARYELRSYIPEDGILHGHRCGDLKCDLSFSVTLIRPSILS